jgi:hypothetical protein
MVKPKFLEKEPDSDVHPSQGKALKAGSWRTDRTFQLKGDVQIPKTWVYRVYPKP